MIKGEDMTKTVTDFTHIVKWSKKRQIRAAVWYDLFNKDGVCNHGTYYAIIKQLAFNPADMFNRTDLDKTEYAIWYYSGHGLHTDVVNISKPSGFNLLRDPTNDPHSNDGVNNYMKAMCERSEQPWRYLQGGELPFQRYGFFDFHMLVDFLQTAITLDGGRCKNRHILVVLDSCYSGKFGKRLEKWMKGGDYKDVWKRNQCSLTIQTAASEKEPTYGGYFTPLFIRLQDEAFRNEKLEQWVSMNSEFDDIYDELPSPQLYSTEDTISTSNEPLVKLNKVWLVKNPNFFKMCYALDPNNADLQGIRTLTQQDIDMIYDRTNCVVKDFKLKTTESESSYYRGSPMGLFLMSNNVCIHIHFQFKNPSQVGRINLQEYKEVHTNSDNVIPVSKNSEKLCIWKLKTKPPSCKQVYWNWENNTFYYWREIKTKQEVLVHDNDVAIEDESKMQAVKELLQACKTFVQSNRTNWEMDWKMGASKNGMFRSSLQRSSELMVNLSVMDYIEHPNDTYHAIWRSDNDLDALQQWLGSNGEYYPLKFDKDGLTALHVAAWSGKLVPLKYLVDEYYVSHPKVCSIMKDKFGRTPLHLACHGGHLPVVKYLVEEKNADITIVDNNGNTPVDIASESEQWEIVPYVTLPDIDSLASVRCFI